MLPHFHPCDQFQLVVGGSGRIGAHAVQPYAVHYARRDTGYGPVVAGAEGLSYLSIRAAASWDTHYLPEARALLGPGPRQNLFASPVDRIPPAALRQLRAVRHDPPLAQVAEGELVWTTAAAAGQCFEVDCRGHVAFGLVLAGALRGPGE